MEIICKFCDHVFEEEFEEVGKEGECPSCKRKYVLDFDFYEIPDPVLIPYWEEPKNISR